ncbi:hypothetical protein FUA48_03100 [Flavobacterium alkalisoli]|uniref:Uncharacterized protein n=1 Tax=Flavobacterium alkalisoli TaxID=2602769 RepID=A0A5B9FMV0_9FLAO|nr:hypothetical protein [Flavobacterium alkalisoli]QEE48593.1 hypothetical protein FUA48_03100 [Flavobacterium alkalisoli]
MKLLAFFLSFFVLATQDLSSIRQNYISAATSEQGAEELYKSLEGVSDAGDNTMVGYKAASLTLKAKYEKGLLNKKSLFTQGAKLLESVINRDADNYEVRLLRMSIQENAPKITGYNKDIEEDKKFLIKHYDSQKQDLKEFTKGFVARSALFTKEEKAVF